MNATYAEIIIDDKSHTYLFFSHVPRIGEQVSLLEGHDAEILGDYEIVNVRWLVMPEDWGYPGDKNKNASTAVVISLSRLLNGAAK